MESLGDSLNLGIELQVSLKVLSGQVDKLVEIL